MKIRRVEKTEARHILPRPFKYLAIRWNLVFILVLILFFAFAGLLSK